MTTPVRQASFIGGELAPGFYGRTDLKRYEAALKLCRNMIPLQEGSVLNRPGTWYKGAAVAPSASSTSRLIPFVFSAGTLAKAFVLEAGVGYLRIWRANGTRITSFTVNGVGATEVATTWTAADIPRLHFFQLGQIMTVCGLQSPTWELAWVSDTAWTTTNFTLSRWSTGPTGATVPLAPLVPQAGRQTWQYVITAVGPDGGESSVSNVASIENVKIDTDHPVNVTWDAVASAVEYNVYKGHDGKFGYVGSATGTSFRDDGLSPVYAEAPPSARNPFSTNDLMPQIGTYHDQRIVFANSYAGPAVVEMSKIGEHKNFDRARPPSATDAVTFNVQSDKYEEVRALVSLRRTLLALTSGTEWAVTGSEGLIEQADLLLDPVSGWGSSWLPPLVIGDVVVFQQDMGGTVREIDTAQGFKGNDLTLLAQHLFQGHSIKGWAYQHEPFRVIWAVRDDGVLLSCTYVKQHDTWAWARHDTGSDVFEDVCVVPDGVEQAVYFLVKRTVGGVSVRYMERLANRLITDFRTAAFLDSAVYHPSIVNGVFTGLDHLEGRSVYVLLDGTTYGPYTVLGGQVTTVSGGVAVAGLRITAQGTTLDMFSTADEVRGIRKDIKRVFAEVMESMSFKAGQRLTDTLERATRSDESAWTAANGLYSGLAQVNINSDWDDRGQVVWEHADATPLHILSITREVEFGGR